MTSDEPLLTAEPCPTCGVASLLDHDHLALDLAGQERASRFGALLDRERAKRQAMRRANARLLAEHADEDDAGRN